MSKYRVYFHTGAFTAVEVEAEDADEALDKAYEGLPGGLCAHCSGWGQSPGIDLGDWEADDEQPEEVKS